MTTFYPKPSSELKTIKKTINMDNDLLCLFGESPVISHDSQQQGICTIL